jgi:hypothetical protein
VGQQHALVGDGGLDGRPEVGRRVLARELGALDERVENRGDLGAAFGLAAQMVLPADDRSADGSLRGVVAQGRVRFVDEAGEVGQLLTMYSMALRSLLWGSDLWSFAQASSLSSTGEEDSPDA